MCFLMIVLLEFWPLWPVSITGKTRYYIIQKRFCHFTTVEAVLCLSHLLKSCILQHVFDFFLFTAYLSCRTPVYPVLCQSSCQSDVEQRALLQFVIFQWHSRELQKTVGNIGKRMLVCWLQGRTGCNRTSCSFWPTAPELVAYWSSV